MLELSERIYYRTATNPWGPWSSKTLIYDSATDPNAHQKLFDPGNTDPTAIDANQLTVGQEQEPGHLYSFNIIDWWSDPSVDDGQVLSDIYFNVSTWNPYGVQLWKARIGSATPKVRTSAFFSNWYPHGFTMHGEGWSGGGDRVTMTENTTYAYAIFDGSPNHVYFTDYRFEIDIYPSDDDLLGLYARYNNSGTFYSMHTKKQGGDGRVHITRVRSNVETELGSFPWTYVQNAWSTWAFEVDGDVIRAYIDGVQRAEIIDTAPNRIISGFPGFWTSNQLNARFDNMRLEACK
jgi:hypothetical protein